MKKNIVIIGLTFLCVLFGILLLDSNTRNKNLRKTVDSREVETPAPKITETPITSLTSKEVEKLEAKVASLEEENSKLEKNKKELEAENLNLKSSKENVSSGANLSYLAIKFWYDGNNYEISDTNLYKNVSLTKKIKGKVIIVSPTISEDHLDNGLTIYTVMSLNGPIFMSSYPYLSVIEGSHLKAPASAFNEKETKKYLAIKFWRGEHYKKLYEDSNQTWYTDCSLQKSINNSESIIISSENNDCFVMANGIQVYTSQADDGSILWMHDSPSLETIYK